MSKVCGDTARFYRMRAQNNRKRARMRERSANLEVQKAASARPAERDAV